MTLHLAQVAALFTHAGLAAAGAAAVSIPIAIHLLSRYRRRREPWAAMRFLAEAFRKHRRRLQLEQLLLLLVRCLLVLAFGLALAGPLAGGVARLLGGEAGRLVLVVVDDSLSSQAGERFAQLQKTALGLADGLASQDRVGLWRAGRPVERLVDPARGDAAALRQALETLAPRESASDLAGALEEVARAAAEANRPADQVLVFLLSDFSQDALDLAAPPSPAVQTLARQGRLVVARPAADAANVQVAALRPRRGMVLLDPAVTPAVPVELRLRRYAEESPGSVASLTVALLDPEQPQPLGQVQRTLEWSAGQEQAVVNLALPVPPAAVNAAERRTLAVEARVDTAGAPDALSPDNRRWALVEVRRQLRVAIVGDSAPPPGEEVAPETWVELALTPQSGPAAQATAPVQAVRLEPDLLDEPRLAGLDAVILLRPDRVDPAGWNRLAEFARRGGLLWIFPPAEAVPALWAERALEALELKWRLELDALTLEGDETARARRLALEAAPPPALQLLSADWQALLRPVRIDRLYPLAGVEAEDLWLAGADGRPVLAGAAVGEGHVMLSTVALGPVWTNLLVKPLFVPLLHETLRGVLGAPRAQAVEVGDQPTLGWRWREAQGLRSLTGRGAVGVETTAAGPRAAAPLVRPGVYAALPESLGERLAVNIAPAAGDTRALDNGLLADWLDRLGAWTWLEEAQPAAALRQQPARANLGWPLLWLTLALAVVEMALARWFSHAEAPGGREGRAGA